MKLKVALDWTPNVIHAGMYLAQIDNLWGGSDLEVEYISVEIDNYQKKTTQRLAEGEVHIALSPSEHLLDFRLLQKEQHPIKAIATVMQQETSAFVTLPDSGITRPAQLDGKTYGGYKTQLEKELLTNLIQQDGGQGDIDLVTPPRLEVFEAFLQQQFDTAWVFVPWEGVIAERRGKKLNAFHLHDYQIPYGYSPILMVREDVLEAEKESFQAFLTAVGKGYQQAANNPEETAQKLVENVNHPNFEDIDFITQAMQVIAPSFLNEQQQWGTMKPERWSAYVQWLSDHKLLNRYDNSPLSAEQITTRSLYTNKLLND
ncbi:ABC transporter substrate-binding protein [Tunicatimonas pelagia]|uniref:ABC transporter substrate-binding protein n=1 Tax=Tunicatimonas pelagia TaxID=931531 RepID=UPI0026666718|nr:ABC transporter substrate-binding protein [Tunicatimonas pelagia]WKN41812.1 ABC transporter substrate-binding protein [Tunicatimonas pelagia]